MLALSGRPDLATAQQRLDAFLSAQAVPARARYACELVLEECLANLFEHARPARPGTGVQVDVAVSLGPEGIELRFDDNACAFDPTQRTDPPLPRSIDEARPGGLGLMLVRRQARRIEYHRQAGGNRLLVLIGSPPGGAASA